MTEDRRRKGQAIGAGAGAGAASLAMPTRVFQNNKKSPYKNLPSGEHKVPMKDVHAVARNTGRRLQNKEYTAGLARHLQGSKDKGKLTVHVDDKGNSRQIDGAHRTWANTMNGEKEMNVRVVRTEGPRSTKTLAGNISSEVRSAMHRRRLRRDQGLAQKSPKKFNRLADGAHPNTRHKNEILSEVRQLKAKASGDTYDPTRIKRGPSTKALRMKQGKFLVGGAAAGAGAVALGQKAGFKREDDVKKSATASAFGVEHG